MTSSRDQATASCRSVQLSRLGASSSRAAKATSEQNRRHERKQMRAAAFVSRRQGCTSTQRGVHVTLKAPAPCSAAKLLHPPQFSLQHGLSAQQAPRWATRMQASRLLARLGFRRHRARARRKHKHHVADERRVVRCDIDALRRLIAVGEIRSRHPDRRTRRGSNPRGAERLLQHRPRWCLSRRARRRRARCWRASSPSPPCPS